MDIFLAYVWVKYKILSFCGLMDAIMALMNKCLKIIIICLLVMIHRSDC